ncbi:tetratricopeptide repeat protein [Mucilaginibacter sp. Bleaf8]|uniref:tetratricopeptide repeat-containing sensor histidine kinase n=1 Tax=Mucilaginibacter sp. Bleaf8 TaxID=2834430 RepID=UPI001BCADC17|nr:tetratricopeptide repeat-containing sensor histidine kinase [Mucilaginibacter sp. Bleaf8]MBS7562964.1 tetratricopeptide repeat protein [Mucilaginibacter sp. Bleaf8]
MSSFNYPPDTLNHKKLTIKDYDRLISYYRYYKPDSAVYLAKQGIIFSRQCRNDSGVAVMLNQLGMIDDNFGRFEESRDKYLQALAIYQRAHNVKGISVETIRLGVVELRKGNYDKAIGYFLHALKVSEQGKNATGKMEAYLTLAEGYMGQRKYDVALTYLNKAEALNETLPFSNLSLNIYNNYGVIYRETGDYPQAIAYLQKGIGLSTLPQYQGLNITLTNNLAKVYSKLGDRNRSIDLQEAALAKARKIHNYLRELQTLTGLADTYSKLNPTKAIAYLKQAQELVKEKGSRKQEMEVLNDLAAIYKAQKNYLDALMAKEQEHTIADSFYYQHMSRQITSLQSAYELQRSEAKVKELKLINSRDELQRNLILLVTVSCLVILIIVCLSLYRSNKLNKLLNSANVSLKESNTVKDKLFSVLAHDLRAPFASIIDMLYFINDDDITDEERSGMIDKLALTSSASLETLNMLLRWGQMQIKGVKVNPDKVKPQMVFERSLALLSSAAEKKQINIQEQIPAGTKLLTDPDHFEFVIRNLLSNAIKFTPTGGTITVGCEVQVNNKLEFWVSDTGVGIAPERMTNLFNITSVSTPGTNNETGTALGLVMCKEFVEANDGSIWVESELGKGSVFKFTLPYRI